MNPPMSKEHILYEMNSRAIFCRLFILIIVNVTVAAVRVFIWMDCLWVALLLKYKWDIKYSSGNEKKTKTLLYALIL